MKSTAVAVAFVVPPTAKECNECQYIQLLEKSIAAQTLLMRAKIITASQHILWAADGGNLATIPNHVRAIVDALPKG